MKIDRKNFNSFYIEEIQSKLALLELERKRMLKLFFVIVGLVFMFSCFISIKQLRSFNILSIFIVLSPTIITACLMYFFTFRKFKINYKNKIIKLLFNSIFDDYFYRPDGYLTEAEYQSTLLYQGNFNRFSGEDCIEGVFKGKEIKLSELLVRRVENRKKKNTTKIIFNGLMVIFKMKTPYVSQIVVEPDFAEKILGFMGRAIQSTTKGNLEIVRLESPDFEKNFIVYSNDQIEVRRFLTPLIQEKLTNFKKMKKTLFAFSIQSNQISIALPNSKNQFEPNYFSRTDDVKIIREIIDLFLFFDELLSHLNS